MKISIVTAYHNRKKQLINTLETIKKSSVIEETEFILVDDCSDENERVEDLQSLYPFFKVIRLEKKDKWYHNPCIPFNIGISQANGDIIVLQNPECLHMGDILSYVVENVNDINYLTFSTYAINQIKTENISKLNFNEGFINNKIKEVIGEFKMIGFSQEGEEAWYNHSFCRPSYYHFVSAITKKNMKELGGFDERYSEGHGFDDDELLFRIRKMGLKTEIVNEPIAIHQWHYTNLIKDSILMNKAYKNQQIFNNITKKLNTHKIVN
jgi:GT2 family glycosyltransferase